MVKQKINVNEHEICSFDACSLFTSLHLERTVNYITEKIYNNIEQFFPVSDETLEFRRTSSKNFVSDFFLKPSASECLTNYKYGISPKS